MPLRVVDHPAVRDRLARLRDRATEPASFRRLMRELGGFLAYEATRNLAIDERTAAPPVVAPILRAGLGFLDAFLAVTPDAVVAHLGFFRDPVTFEAVPYYANLPERLDGIDVFVLDPMLATGHSALAALALLASRGAKAPTFVCAIAAPEGVRAVERVHPSVLLVAAALDERLDEHAYIVPGLGDAGDRLYGSTSSLPASYRRPSSI
ncbi:MAG: uracil phosphoribosyltransferase [Candidatus Baltobacteraceae bacterium]